MSLFAATFFLGLLLAAFGSALLWNGPIMQRHHITWMRSKPASWVLFGGASLWFLWHVWHLGEADFGNFKHILLLLFGGTAFGAFFYVRELLAARGAAMLVILGALPLLNAAYMRYEEPQRLFLVTGVYVLLTLGIICGAMPWRLRDFATWLYRQPQRVRRLGQICVGYGAILLIVSLTY